MSKADDLLEATRAQNEALTVGGVKIPNASNWEKEGDRLSSGDAMNIATSVTENAVHALLFAKYIEVRKGTGSGQQTHQEAVKEVRKLSKAARRAIGFSDAGAGIPGL